MEWTTGIRLRTQDLMSTSEEIWAFVSRYSISGMSGFGLTVNTTGEGSVTAVPWPRLRGEHRGYIDRGTLTGMGV